MRVGAKFLSYNRIQRSGSGGVMERITWWKAIVGEKNRSTSVSRAVGIRTLGYN